LAAVTGFPLGGPMCESGGDDSMAEIVKIRSKPAAGGVCAAEGLANRGLSA
jgi:hypothetical protein